MKGKILKVIFSAVDETNSLLPNNKQLTKSIKTPLFGDSGELDSLGLVSFIVATEEKIEEEFGVPISLADEKAEFVTSSSFKTIGSLADYICLLLNEKENGYAEI